MKIKLQHIAAKIHKVLETGGGLRNVLATGGLSLIATPKENK